MRKTLLAGLVVMLALALTAPPASANTLSAGDKQAKFNDWSNLYEQTDGWSAPTAFSAVGPTLGEELRGLFSLTTIHDVNNPAIPEWSASINEERTGVLYDLELVAIHLMGGGALLLDFAPKGRNPLVGTGSPATFGGVLELYSDLTPDLTPNPGNLQPMLKTSLPVGAPYAAPGIPGGAPGSAGPWFWIEGDPPVGHAVGTAPAVWPGGAGADAYPGATDGGNLWLAGVFVDFITAGIPIHPGLDMFPGVAGVDDDGDLVIDNPSELGWAGSDDIVHNAATVWSEVFDLTVGSGSGSGYVHAVGGTLLAALQLNKYGPFMEIELGAHLTFPKPDYGPDGIPGNADDQLIDSPNYHGVGHWQVDSFDPANFGIIPEPASLSLLGLSLLGLAVARWRKK